MYFVRSGDIALSYGSLRDASGIAILWTSVAFPASPKDAFYLNISRGTLRSSTNDRRQAGFSLSIMTPTSGTMGIFQLSTPIAIKRQLAAK